MERVTLIVLEDQFPTFFQCYVNSACVRGMIAARDAAIDAIRTHGGTPNDYLATKYLVAWQHLGLIGSHTGLARAAITALAPEIAAW